MIEWNEKIKKSGKIFNSVIDGLNKENIIADGVIEIFNDGKEQGALLKVFDKYNPCLDLCIWCYLPSNRTKNNSMNVIVGYHNDCDKNNMWNNKEIDIFNFETNQATELQKEVREFVLDTIIKNFEKTRDI